MHLKHLEIHRKRLFIKRIMKVNGNKMCIVKIIASTYLKHTHNASTKKIM